MAPDIHTIHKALFNKTSSNAQIFTVTLPKKTWTTQDTQPFLDPPPPSSFPLHRVVVPDLFGVDLTLHIFSCKITWKRLMHFFLFILRAGSKIGSNKKTCWINITTSSFLQLLFSIRIQIRIGPNFCIKQGKCDGSNSLIKLSDALWSYAGFSNFHADVQIVVQTWINYSVFYVLRHEVNQVSSISFICLSNLNTTFFSIFRFFVFVGKIEIEWNIYENVLLFWNYLPIFASPSTPANSRTTID